MKILNAKQIKALDKATIINEPIYSIDLMDRASFNAYSWLVDQYVDRAKTIHVFCGVGNNGGDGLAIAGFLYEDNLDVKVYLVHFSSNLSDDLVTQFNQLEEEGLHPINIQSKEDFPVINHDDVVVDAIFGVGLNKPASGFTKELIQHINKHTAPVYSIDVPSGLYIDKPNSKADAIIKPDKVATFQLPKLAFLLPDNQDYVPHFDLLDIELDLDFLTTVKSNFHFITLEDILPLIKKRKKFSHKGDFGHSLIIGGSYGKIGAVVLATKAALRIGSGLVTAYVPKSGYTIMQISAPEAMVEVGAEYAIESINFNVKPSVIGIGVGLGVLEKTAKAFGDFLKTNTIPLVIDADALNILSHNKAFLDLLPEDSILTPHPKELKRLIGEWENDYDKLEKIKAFSKKYHCIVVLKGAHTLIVQNETYYFNSTGSPALATAGSGDVLLGLITGLLAQGYTPLQAAMLGVFAHGRSVELHKLFKDSDLLIASDIINLIPEVFGEFVNYIENPIQLETDDYEIDINDDFFDDDFESPF